MLSGREKNVTSTSLRQAGRGLAESQGRQVRTRAGLAALLRARVGFLALENVGEPWGPASRPFLEWVGR